MTHAGLVEARERGRCSGGAEGGARALGAAVRRTHMIGSQRKEEAAAHVVAQCNRMEKLAPGATVAFGHRERGRYHRATRMRLGRRIEIVGLVGVTKHGIGERG